MRHLNFVRLTVRLPANEHQVFVSAVRILKRVMREQAPNVEVLIQSKLLKHDATGLAEDYLDLVGWPHAERRLIIPRRRSVRCTVRSLSRPQLTKSRLAVSPTCGGQAVEIGRN